MTDQRPRPQYGEYASVDEQIAAGGIPVELEPVVTSPTTGVTGPADQGLVPPDPSTRIPGGPPAPKSWDFALSVTLLIFGAYTVGSSIAGLLDFSAVLREVYAQAGYGEYTSDGLADSIGIAILVSQSVLFIATLVVTVLRLRAKRVAFFVPLIGGAVAGLLMVALVLVAMTADPALAAWVTSQS